jgi:HSP20 family protein
MKLIYSIPVLATVFPALATSWSLLPARYGLSLLNDVPVFDTPLTRMLREHERLMDRALSTPFESPMMQQIKADQPKYEIVDDDQEFKIALDIPGVAAKDVNITLDTDGKFLTITGSRESKGDGYMFSSRFSQSFSVDPTVNLDKFSANLDNGVLVIAAPKDVKRLKESVRKIPVEGTKTSTEDATLKELEHEGLEVEVKTQKEKKLELEHLTA